MSMKPVKKAVVNTGKYTAADGSEKNRYLTVGKLLQRDDGSQCLKLDSLPVGEFNGWINFYDLEENRPQQNAEGMEKVAKAMAAPVAAVPAFADDDIPF